MPSLLPSHTAALVALLFFATFCALLSVYCSKIAEVQETQVRRYGMVDNIHTTAMLSGVVSLILFGASIALAYHGR